MSWFADKSVLEQANDPIVLDRCDATFDGIACAEQQSVAGFCRCCPLIMRAGCRAACKKESTAACRLLETCTRVTRKPILDHASKLPRYSQGAVRQQAAQRAVARAVSPLVSAAAERAYGHIVRASVDEEFSCASCSRGGRILRPACIRVNERFRQRALRFVERWCDNEPTCRNCRCERERDCCVQ